jgi:hypothetical protein
VTYFGTAKPLSDFAAKSNLTGTGSSLRMASYLVAGNKRPPIH